MEDNKRYNIKTNFLNLLIISLSLVFLFFSILRIALVRRGSDSYPIISELFSNAIFNLSIWTLIVVIPIIIVFLIAIYSRIRISILVGFISLIMSSIFLFSIPKFIFKKPLSAGVFQLPSADIVGSLEALIIIFPAVLLLSTLLFYIYKKENFKISFIILLISIIFLPFTIYSIYQGSIDFEEYWVTDECNDLISLILIRSEPSTQISDYISKYKYGKGRSINFEERTEKRYNEINNKWGERCKEYIEKPWFENQWYSWSNSKEDIQIEKEKLRNWAS